MLIEDNKVVTFHFTLTDSQGETIQSTRSEEPLAYLHGQGNLIPGLERVMAGKSPGDAFEVTLEPNDAYGERDANLVQQLDRGEFPPEAELMLGSEFEVEDEGEWRVIKVTEIEGDSIMVDGNHPLAGETLNFEIEVVDIREASQEELMHGHVHGPEGHHH